MSEEGPPTLGKCGSDRCPWCNKGQAVAKDPRGGFWGWDPGGYWIKLAREHGKSMGHTHNSVNPEDRVLLVKYINRTPALLSALYDLDLLPEQLEVGSDTELWMLRLAGMFRIGAQSVPQ